MDDMQSRERPLRQDMLIVGILGACHWALNTP